MTIGLCAFIVCFYRELNTRTVNMAISNYLVIF